MTIFASAADYVIGLNQVRDIHRHFFDLCVIKLLNVTQVTDISGGQEVNGNPLTTETTRTTDTVNVIFTVGRQVVVDDQTYLLYVNTTGEQVGGDQYTTGATSELAHDQVTLSLVHVTVHCAYGEVPGGHLLRQPVDLSAGVAVDDRLGDRQGFVQITKGV